jgi:hypothetical protein
MVMNSRVVLGRPQPKIPEKVRQRFLLSSLEGTMEVTSASLTGIFNDDCFELTNEFKKNYEMWLKEEVYCAEEFAIDWDEILKEPSKVLINEIKNSIHYSTYFMKCN